MNLFQYGDFTLSSGQKSNFKIDCDALVEDDWETLAYLIANKSNPFSSVYGIPRGGTKLANCLKKYINHSSTIRLLVDDVYTTGNSIGKERKRNDEIWVVFSRVIPPKGVNALFIMGK